jgi:Transglycosylase SLT domain
MNGCARFVLIALLVTPTMSVAQAGERAPLTNPNAAVSGARSSGQLTIKGLRTNISTMLDRIAYAVDGAESSHGADLTMWRSEPSGPQGPMQVSEAAAADVGGGDRFDSTENRALGRAYLAQLYRRYKNWPDAIAAYNWGIGNVDNWISAGRPPDKFVAGVAAYLRRVLHDSGMCDSSTAMPVGPPRARTLPVNRQSREATEEDAHPEADSLALAASRILKHGERYSTRRIALFLVRKAASTPNWKRPWCWRCSTCRRHNAPQTGAQPFLRRSRCSGDEIGRPTPRFFDGTLRGSETGIGRFGCRSVIRT